MSENKIYSHDILFWADEYIKWLDSPEDLGKRDNNLFSGLIKYINLNLYANNKPDTADIAELDRIWDIYTCLCYRYNHIPFLSEFSILTGISRDTFHTWRTGERRSYIYRDKDGKQIKNLLAWKQTHPEEEYTQEASSLHADAVKRWSAECENAQVRNAAERGAVGSIFLLKASYGYTETAPAPPSPQRLGHNQPEQIADRYGGGLPELPEH